MRILDADEHRQAVHKKAVRFRSALEEGGLLLKSLADFPHGACGDTSELLGQYLHDSGLGDWIHRSGKRWNPDSSHAWLERDGLLLDITADQFEDVSQPVMITKDRTWHSQFADRFSSRIAGLAWFGSDVDEAAARADYRLLVQRADGPPR
jgi:hypothetical protein